MLGSLLSCHGDREEDFAPRGRLLTPRARRVDGKVIAELFEKYSKEAGPVGLLADRRVVLKILQEESEGWRILYHVAPELREDKGLFLAAIRGAGGEGWRALAFAPQNLRSNRGIVREALRASRGAALAFVESTLRLEADMVYESLRAFHEQMLIIEGKASSRRQELFRSLLPVGTVITEYDLNLWPVDAERHQLQSEVSHGICSVLQYNTHEVVRVAQAVTLSLLRHDGVLLVEVGCYDGRSCRVQLSVPGTGIKETEDAKEKMLKFLDENFHGIRSEIDLCEAEHSLETCKATLSMRSVCVRTDFQSHLPRTSAWQQLLDRVPVSSSARIRRSVLGPPPTTPSRTRREAWRFTCKRTVDVTPFIYTVPGAEGQHAGQRDANGRLLHLYSWLPAWEFNWLLRDTAHACAVATEWLATLDKDALHQRWRSLK